MNTDVALLIAAIALIPISGVFAAFETAIAAASAARIDDLIKDSRPGAARLRRVIDARANSVEMTPARPLSRLRFATRRVARRPS